MTPWGPVGKSPGRSPGPPRQRAPDGVNRPGLYQLLRIGVRVRIRAFSVLALGVALGVFGVLGGSGISPAQAAVYVPPQVNVPGSLVGGAAVSSPEALGAILLQNLQTERGRYLLGRAAELTANPSAPPLTATETAELAEIKKRSPVPWAKVGGTLAKTVGGTAAALSTYSLGTTVGGGVVSLFGIDAAQTVCSNTMDAGVWGALTQAAAGVNCSAFEGFPQNFQPNLGLVAAAAGWVDAKHGQAVCDQVAQGLYVTGEFTSAFAAGADGRTYTARSLATSWPANGGTITSTSTCADIGMHTISAIRYCWNGGDKANSSNWNRSTIAPFSSWYHDSGTTTNDRWFKRAKAMGGATGGTMTLTCPSTHPQLYALKLGASASYEADQGVSGYPAIADYFNPAQVNQAPTQTTSANFMAFFAPASPSHVPGSVPDPTRTLECVVLGSDGVTYTGASETFTEGGGVLPTPKCASLPAGVSPSTVTIKETGGGETHELFRQDASPEYQSLKQLAPECADGTCLTDLRLNSSGETCFTSANVAACKGWFTDPDKATKYACYTGSHMVALSQCTIYAPAFEPQHQETGRTLGDPSTGAPLPVNTGQAPGAAVTPGTSPADDCWANGWPATFDPLGWVLTPIKCAWTWAMVPRTSVVDGPLDGLTDKWSGKAPGVLLATVGAWDFVAPGDGCSGIPIDMEWLWPGTGTIHILPACPGDMFADFAGWSKTFFYVAFSVVGVVGLSRHVARIFGYGGVGDAS